MSKKRQKIDKRKMVLGFSFEEQVEAHLAKKAELLARLTTTPPKPAPAVESDAEACIEMAAAVKRAIRDCGKSREQMVDQINACFAWKACKGNSGEKLSIHMFNDYLSTPAEYPMRPALLIAIHHASGSIEPLKSLAAAIGGDVSTRRGISGFTISIS